MKRFNNKFFKTNKIWIKHNKKNNKIKNNQNNNLRVYTFTFNKKHKNYVKLIRKVKNKYKGITIER